MGHRSKSHVFAQEISLHLNFVYIAVFFVRLGEMGLPLEPYDWYLDLRKYGSNMQDSVLVLRG